MTRSSACPNAHSPEASLLLVDDDASLRQALAAFLIGDGFAVRTSSEAGFEEEFETGIYDLVILGVAMSSERGLAMLRQTGNVTGTPTIVLNDLWDRVDRIVALELGADDCVEKPVGRRELAARVRAVMRRARRKASIGRPDGETLTYFAGWTFDFLGFSLFSPSGDAVELSPGEYHLLKAFTDRAGRILSRTQLIYLTRDGDQTPSDRAIDVQISRLRHKLDSGSSRSEPLIRTLRGDGYQFTGLVTKSYATAVATHSN